jgi:hypothetical protein
VSRLIDVVRASISISPSEHRTITKNKMRLLCSRT